MTNFQLGQIVTTRGVDTFVNKDPDTAISRTGQLMSIISRYMQGDWGDCHPEDAESNNVAVAEGHRIMGAYKIDEKVVWVITEWDRSVTAFLFPDEY